MTAAVLDEKSFVEGSLPLPGWPDGKAFLRLPTEPPQEIVVVSGQTSDLKLFVWNWLRPGTSYQLIPPSNGHPGLLGFEFEPPKVAPSKRKTAGGHEPPTIESLLDQAFDWMGELLYFEQFWAFCIHRGVTISATELRDAIGEECTVSSEGLIRRLDSADAAYWGWEPAAWDCIEKCYWELLQSEDVPHLERVYRKREKGRTDGLEPYLDGLHHKLLTKEEERKLGADIQRGLEAQEELHRHEANHDRKVELGLLIRTGDRAKDEFIAGNRRLVFAMAKKYWKKIQGTSLGIEDLVQDGEIGLRRAAEKFDPRKGFKFSTYATWWIKQAITRSIADHGRTIRLPAHRVDPINQLLKAEQEHQCGLNRLPSDSDLAEKLGISIDEVMELKRWAATPLSLDELSLDEDDYTPVEDEPVLAFDLPEEISSDPSELVSSRFMEPYLRDVFEGLTERQTTILRMRYGLDGGEPKTLEQCGAHYGITRERIRQIEKQTLATLGQHARFRQLGSFLNLALPEPEESDPDTSQDSELENDTPDPDVPE